MEHFGTYERLTKEITILTHVDKYTLHVGF